MAIQLRRAVGLLAGIGVLGFGYAGAVGYLKLYERDFIFRPGERRVAAPPSRFALRETRVMYPSSDGVTLSAWIVPASGGPDRGRSLHSIADRGQELYPMFPIRLIAAQRFPSLDRIASIGMPKLFLHSPEDDVIPYGHGRRLFAAARDPRRFVDERGGHDAAFRIDKTAYYGAIGAFLRDPSGG